MATAARPERLYFSADDDANALLARDPLALLIGFCLDQQVPVQKAFAGPLELKRRLGRLDARAIAELPTEELEALFAQKPALHRFPGSMARRTQELCRVIASDYGGAAARVWEEAADADDLRRRIESLPGFGEMKVKSLAAVLAKRLGVEAARTLVPSHPTLGDVDSPEALAEYQRKKREHKASLKKR